MCVSVVSIAERCLCLYRKPCPVSDVNQAKTETIQSNFFGSQKLTLQRHLSDTTSDVQSVGRLDNAPVRHRHMTCT